MVFSGLTFLLLFLPLLLGLYFISGNIHWRNGVLVLFSLLFYAWGEPIMVWLMVLATLVNYLCGLVIAACPSRHGRRLWLLLGAVVSLAGLVYFKYAGFLLESLGKLLHISLSFQAPALPIGISFYTFQILTYTVDVYRKKVPVQKNFFRLLLYVSCFPQLIAGPIVQYGDIAGALEKRTSNLKSFTDGMDRFFVGLAKKVLLANVCGAALEGCTLGGGKDPLSLGGAWLGALLYTLQLYYDFSAYSDMAIGLGKVLGFTYKENFLYPYISLSPTEFWRRWHISLGAFFRDYVYIPLGGNRRGRLRTTLNLFVVWFLTGLWHGASWNFVLWGLYWFVLQQIDKALPNAFKESVPALLRGLLTFVLANLGWVLFYYTDFGALEQHLSAMFSLRGGWIDEKALTVLGRYGLFLLAALVGCFPWLPALKKRLWGHKRWRKTIYVTGTMCACLLGALSVVYLVCQSYNPFIYFRF